MAADPTTTDLRRRFTVDEYEHMFRTGVLTEDDRTELLDGEVVTMSPIGPRHSSTVSIINRVLVLALGERAIVRIQDPVRLPPRSEPEPDIVVVRNRDDFYVSAHPTAEDTLLVIEVSESPLRADRAIKLPIYARAGIAEVWILDVTNRRAHVHAHPVDGTYRDTRTLVPGDVLVPTAIAEVAIPVSDVLR